VNFLLLTQYFAPEIGATQVRLGAIARQLKAMGHGVEVVTAMPHHLVGEIFPGYRRKFYSTESWHGVTIHRTWVYPATGAGLKRLFNYLSFTVSSFFGLSRARRPDIVFIESPPLFLSLAGMTYGALRHTKTVFNVSDLWPDSVRELGILDEGPIMECAYRLERWSYRRADYVNAVTDGIYRALADKKGVPKSKLLFLPNGVDSELFAPRPADESLCRQLDLVGKKVCLYAGTHGIAQGLENVIRAAALLQSTDIVFLFLGDGPEKSKIISLAGSLGLSNIRFVDSKPLDQVPRYYNLAFASIVPLIKNELFKGARPSKILPSLACGVPVIYSGEGEAAELIEGAKAGLVVEPESPTAIAEALRVLASNAEMSQAMAENGRRLMLKRFAWPAIVSSWLAQLEGVQAQPLS